MTVILEVKVKKRLLLAGSRRFQHETEAEAALEVSSSGEIESLMANPDAITEVTLQSHQLSQWYTGDTQTLPFSVYRASIACGCWLFVLVIKMSIPSTPSENTGKIIYVI